VVVRTSRIMLHQQSRQLLKDQVIHLTTEALVEGELKRELFVKISQIIWYLKNKLIYLHRGMGEKSHFTMFLCLYG